MEIKSRKNGSTNGSTAPKGLVGSDAATRDNLKMGSDHKVDNSREFEFGGVWGTGLAMVFFPLLMWYMWVGQVYYDSQFPMPERGEAIGHFVGKVVNLAYEVWEICIFSFLPIGAIPVY